MFGFLKGSSCNVAYRRVYARACSAHWQNHGRFSTLFHSYEAVFLHCLAVDWELAAAPKIDQPTCCRLWHRSSNEIPEDVAAFCSAFGILLLRIKLDDDISDDNSRTARFLRYCYRRRFEEAKAFFNSLDPGFQTNLERILAAHRRVESNPSSQLRDYQRPTARGFRYLFELFGQVSRVSKEQIHALGEIGERIGNAIIAFDCAVDQAKDQRSGNPNPLRSAAAAAEALLTCQQDLAAAGWLCQQSAPDSIPITSDVLRARFRSVAQIKATMSRNTQPAVQARSLRTLLRLRKGDCDCLAGACGGCDCGGCDCSGCGDGGGECVGAECCDHSGNCCGSQTQCVAPCDLCCIDSCDRQKKPKQTAEDKVADQQHTGLKDNLASMIGRRGTTLGQLNPAGVVEIDGVEYPAQSSFGLLDGQTQITVVREDDFGLIVQPANDSE